MRYLQGRIGTGGESQTYAQEHVSKVSNAPVKHPIFSNANLLPLVTSNVKLDVDWSKRRDFFRFPESLVAWGL